MTPAKLNKKELIALYHQSTDQVREVLCAELGADFFGQTNMPIEAIMIIDSPKKEKQNRSRKINLETFFEMTPMVRVLAYALLVSLILKAI